MSDLAVSDHLYIQCARNLGENHPTSIEKVISVEISRECVKLIRLEKTNVIASMATSFELDLHHTIAETLTTEPFKHRGMSA